MAVAESMAKGQNGRQKLKHIFLVMNQQPIGIFDSGLGGLSVWREVRALLPAEAVHYLADSANCPYGPRSREEIIELSCRNTEFLLTKNCKLIVVACNTATAAAIDYLRERYPVPFVGMEPAIKPAAQLTKSGRVGILATQGTLQGKLFRQTRQKYAADIETILQVGHGLVELVEEGQHHSPKAEALLRKYLEPMLDRQADQLVLGCTHYPFLCPLIHTIVGDRMNIIDPAIAVARQVSNLLKQNHWQLSGSQQGAEYFYSSGSQHQLETFLQQVVRQPQRHICQWPD